GKVLPKALTDHGSPQIFGWRHGYVALTFETADDDFGGPTRLISSSSRDGLHWTAPRTAPMPASMAGDDGIGYHPVLFQSVLEGPGGLLAVGSGSGGTCGPPSSYDALWTSRDGVAWRPVTLPRA